MKKGISWKKSEKYRVLVKQQNRLEALIKSAKERGDKEKIKQYRFHLRETKKGIEHKIFSG